MVMDHGGRQVYALHSFGDWLYFTGSIGGASTFRVKKGQGPLLVRGSGPWDWLEQLGPWSGSIYVATFHSDATDVYWIDKTAIFHQGPDGVVDSVELDADPYPYYVLGGDEDTVFAATDACIRIALMDKVTREVRVFEPENLISLGGATAVVSDGKKVYCVGKKSLLEPGFIPQSAADVGVVLHAIDKDSGVVASIPVTASERISGISAMLYDDGTVYSASDDAYWFGALDVGSGALDGWVNIEGVSIIHRDKRTQCFYWSDGHSVTRFEQASRESDYVVPYVPGSGYAGIAADDDYLYWVQLEHTIRSTGHKVYGGIVRVPKPQ
jgi:hypothetical protein